MEISAGSIYAQRFDADDAKVGEQVRVSTATAYEQSLPAVAVLADGGYVVTWQSDGQDGAGDGIYAQRYDAASVRVGGETRINSTTADDQSSPAIAGLAGGGYVVTWQSWLQDGSGWGIYAQRYDAAGAKVGAETRVNTTTIGNQWNPDIAALADGGYVVVWDADAIYAQQFDAAGAKVGREIQVNSEAYYHTETPAVAGLADGGFAVTWTSWGQDNDENEDESYGVYARVYLPVPNNAPVVANLLADQSVTEGGAFSFTVPADTFSDADPEDSLTLSAAGLPAWLVFDAASGTFSGTPGNDAAGTVDIAVTATDKGGARATDTFTLTVIDNGILTGTDGNDTLTGDSRNNQLLGLAGDDSLTDGAGRDTLDGGPGNDTLTDTSGPTEFYGGAGDDSIHAYGNGSSWGGTGNLISGGDGNDTAIVDLVNGGDCPAFVLTLSDQATASDGTQFRGIETLSIVAGSGSDQIVAGSGNDSLSGNGGDDRLSGKGGDDWLAGGAGRDTLDGGDGNDTVSGGDGRDLLTGAAGDDSLDGGAGGDTLDGGEGNDTLIAAAGSSLTGGAGDDVARLVRDTAVTLVFADGATASDGTRVFSTERLWMTSGDGADAITGGAGADTLETGAGDDTLSGGDGDDVLNPGTGSDRVDGGGGFDRVIVDRTGTTTAALLKFTTSGGAFQGTTLTAIEALTFLGGDGADSVQGAPYADVLAGNGGNDTLSGGAGGDSLTGGSGADSLLGESGDDRLEGGNGNDTLDPGTGTDTLSGDAGIDLAILDRSAATAGFALKVGGVAKASDGTVLSGIEALHFLGGSGADSVSGGTDADRLSGGGGNDTLLGGLGADSLEGGVGNDSLSGGAGNDTLSGGDGNDALDGGENSDVLSGDAGADTLFGRAGSDLLTGGTGADSLSGGDGNDSLVGNEDSDSLDGGSGNDSLDAGAGSDSLAGGAGTDTLSGGAGDDSYRIDGQGADTIIETADAGRDTVTATASGYRLADNLEVLVLAGSAHTGSGNALDNLLTGTGGNDKLSGEAGNDSLTGGAGNDSLFGGAGNDTLDGGAGGDSLVGGSGNDLYVISGSGDGVVEGTGGGTDTVLAQSGGYTLGANLEGLILAGRAVSGTGNSAANTLTGNAVGNLMSAAGGNDTLDGGDGNDTLDGGAGTDSLIGGAGDDVYTVDVAGDLVVEAGGAGRDRVNSLAGSYTIGANVEELVLSGWAITGIGNALANTLTGTSGNNRLVGEAGDDLLTGGSGKDTLEGGAGADTLDGGAGGDSLIGGAGNDTYKVDVADVYSIGVAGDRIVELENGGTDQVISLADSFTLESNLENLILSGSAAFGFGNDLANVITGTPEDNGLSGRGGNDTLSAGAGNDMLDGGAGADVMIGGAGNDSYRVDVTGDVVTEVAGGGSDTVSSSVNSYTLPANVEGLSLSGSAITGIGNALSNRIEGNDRDNSLFGGAGDDTLYGMSGEDTLDGGSGNDSLMGGTGDDLYFVDATGDDVFEAINAGSDSVQADVSSYTLPANVEDLVLLDSALTGIGNALDNAIAGNSAANKLTGKDGEDTLTGGSGQDTLDGGANADYLNGGAGNDVLTGGGGADTFQFNTSLSQKGIDRITDFSVADDIILLDREIYQGIDVLINSSGFVVAPKAFHIGAAAGDASDRVIYNSATGALYYDSDGTGSATAIQVATLSKGLALTNADFLTWDWP